MMTTMAQIELDSVKTSNFSAIDKFYESNLSAIVRLDSPSPSIVTCSSKSSKSKTKRCIDESDGSTCASDSEPEELELNAIRLKDQFLKYHQQDSCQSKPSNQLFSKDGNLITLVNHNVGSTENSASTTKIDSVAIQNSTDIQFGNKTFYNGPVFIKQFIRDENKRWISSPNEIESAQIESGVENKGYNDSTCDTKDTETNKAESCNDTNQIKIKNLVFSRKILVLTILTTICIFLGIVLLTLFFIYGNQLQVKEGEYGNKPRLSDGDDSRRIAPINSTIGSDLLSTGDVLRIVSRDEWLAQPPAADLANLKLPVSRIVVAHTATDICETQAACTLRVRLFQTFHMESKGWDDISYNWIVGGDGSVYEGRGWDKQGAHTRGYNSGSIGIAYIGTFINKLPNHRQLKAGFLLMNEGVKEGKLTADYKIYAHRQLIASESPGTMFYKTIKTWSHWRNDTPENFN